MPRPKRDDPELLRAALVGLQHSLEEINGRIADIKSRLGGTAAYGSAASAGVGATGRKKRTLSAAARRRIAMAQRARWAALKAGKPGGAAKPKRKRKISAEGLARIAAASKKRWAAFRKAQAAKTVRRRRGKTGGATPTPPAASPVAAD